MTRRTLIKIWIIILILTIGGVSWWFFFRDIITPIDQTGSNLINSGGVDSLGDQPEQVSVVPVVDYWLDSQGTAFLFGEDGFIYKQDSKISETYFDKPSHLIPSPDGKYAIIVSGLIKNQTFSIFEAQTGKVIKTLPAETSSAAWSPDSPNRIAYLGPKDGKNYLFIATLDDNDPVAITIITQQDILLDWVVPEAVDFQSRFSAKTSGSLWRYYLEDRRIEKIFFEEPGLLIKWFGNNLGLKLSNNTLSIIDNLGQEIARVNDSAIPSKCVVVLDALLYCAQPDQGEVSVDDYLMRKTSSADVIAVYAPSGGSELERVRTIVLSSVEFFNADNLQLFDGGTYFINRFDGFLYRASLQ